MAGISKLIKQNKHMQETIIEQITPDTTVTLLGELIYVREATTAEGNPVTQIVHRMPQVLTDPVEHVVTRESLSADNQALAARVSDMQDSIDRANASKAENDAMIARIDHYQDTVSE